MASVAGPITSSRILDWYGQKSSRRVDLVGDYAGKELFLLEGDSLLLRCFNDPKLDLTGGFQLLHAVYAVERFLLGLNQRHCNFHIVFFEANRECCIPRGISDIKRSRYLLARSIIRRHLMANLVTSKPSIKIRTFASIEDVFFRKYLMDTGVYFVMCHDGANADPTSTVDSFTEQNHDRPASIETEEKRRRTRFRAMIYTLMNHGYNVALINGLDFMDTKVMTMVVEGSRTAGKLDELETVEVPPSTIPDDKRAVSSLETSFAVLGLRLGLGPPGGDSDNYDWDRESASRQYTGSRNRECQCLYPQPPCSNSFTERVYLMIIVLGKMLKSDVMADSLATAFLIHSVMLGSVPLSGRRLQMSSQINNSQSEMNAFVAEFSKLSSMILEEKVWTGTMEASRVICDISDLIDGRLLEAVYSNAMEYALDPQQASTFEMLAHALCAISGVHLKTPPLATAAKARIGATNVPEFGSLTILPFSNPVFDNHLSSINIKIEPLKTTERLSGRIYQEVSHWHNAKRRLDPRNIPQMAASDKEKLRTLRRNQFFMAEMQSYAASLTNAAGKALVPKTVTVSTVNHAESSKESKRVKPHADKLQNLKATPNRKGQGKKAILDGIAANKAVKDSENDEKIFSAWRTVRRSLEAESSLEVKYLKIKAYLRDLTEQKRAVLEAEVNYHLLCILVNIYHGLCKEVHSKAVDSAMQETFATAAMIWDGCRRLGSMNSLTKTIAQKIIEIVHALKFSELGPLPTQNDRKLAYDPALLLPKGEELAIQLNGKEFQLLHCGPYMDRNLDSTFDPRVPFRPDGWQRQVLDELDAKNSVFVVAPTSAGKTFISFYAMERILRSDDESVLVYVAPTKALVNQIAAEIQARFSKSYKHSKSVWAIHTRDYRINNPSGCQILVTVPHILQIMLLAPSNAKSWSPRVKYIIFDEIHSIGQAEDGVVWEQLLLLAPCPIIALSATVGNPEAFNAWLNSTQQSAGHQVTMIKHQHRYSDLRKFVFDPPKRFAFVGLSDRSSFATLGLDGLDGLRFIHPVASLVNKSRGIPDDLSLEARDCLTLFRAMKKHETAEFPVDPTLGPSNLDILPDVIRKTHIIKWEKELKQLLKAWMKNDKSPFDKVVEDLTRPLEVAPSHEQQVSKGETTDARADHFNDVEPGDLYATTLPLLCKLHERNALPAIFFNYNRHICEGLALAVLQQLEDAESQWKQTSPAWKAKLKGWEEWKKIQAKTGARKPPRAAAKKKGKGEEDDEPASKMDRFQDTASDEADPYVTFDPSEPLDGFHFAAKPKADAAELSGYFYQMKRRGVSPELTKALRRGIGVHHAGMNRKYRQVVEMLFRKGFLRVVIATGTLALGINMPCATVVFSGDSIFLTALNFRQAAGRAGRRGFDLLGNVVFQNISNGKICRLLSSRLPDLNGHFPLTTTLVLRLFSLLHESGASRYAKGAIDSLLSQPRLYLDGPAFKDQVLHHLRFSIEYLRRQDLLSSQGAPINFAGLTSHLYFTEHSSFALNALIKGGYFHELCSEIDSRESHVLRTLMVVMAHLFGRRPCREADAEYIENVVKRSASIVFLPALPPQAAKILRKHNEDTLQVFTTYVQTFVDQHIHADDNKLPLTGMKAGGSDDVALLGSLPPSKVRSSFVALSGHGDSFESISDLCQTARSGVYLEEAVIPHLDIYPDESKTPLNAYLYDFYMHGDIESLERANGVKKSDVWFLLNDFSLVLATITASLANFMKLPDSDLSLLDIVGEGDEANNAEDDNFAADSTTETESTATSTATTDTGRTSVGTASSAGSKSKTKKKDVGSWEDDDVDDEEENGQDIASGAIDDELSKEELERGFLNVYKAIKKLRHEFDTKFRKIFA